MAVRFICGLAATLSVFLIGVGVFGAYRFEQKKAAVYAGVSFFGVIAFLVSVTMIFIPDFLVK